MPHGAAGRAGASPPRPAPMNGVLLIDKPAGLTSHDVVARMRRALRERAIGHAGTLDPMATGLLVLVIGRATRLASLLTGHDKTYEATIRLGQATSTDDAEGVPLGTPVEVPDETAVRAALQTFSGTFPQTPPAHSAKKVAGTRAYQLARANRPVALSPVSVTLHDVVWESFDGRDLRLRLRVSAGFYVRALARDLGARLGGGGHLAALRRVASGHFLVDDAMPLAAAEAAGSASFASLVAPADALPDLAAAVLTDEGLRRVLHGNAIGPAQLRSSLPDSADPAARVRLLADDGRLVALARQEAGSLHPVVVLG